MNLDNVREGETIEGYFTVSGGASDIGFSLQASSGQYLVTPGRATGRYNFQLKAPSSGDYTMVFDNSFSLVTSKYVTVEIRYY